MIHYWIKNILKSNHNYTSKQSLNKAWETVFHQRSKGECAFNLRRDQTRGERRRQNFISTYVIFLFREVDFKEFGQWQVIQSLGFYFNHNNVFSMSNLFSLFNETHRFIKTHFFLLVFNLVPKILISQILANLHWFLRILFNQTLKFIQNGHLSFDLFTI